MAWALAAAMGPYERRVASRRHALLSGLEGTVVEIGPGVGANLRWLPASVRWIGVEPNAHARARLQAAADRMGRPVEFAGGAGERIDLPDASADAVVCTLVLCSVADAGATLREVRRVLRPGGTLHFLEHVAAPSGSLTRAAQRAIRPAWRRIAGGCEPDRDTLAAIEQAGFADIQCERFGLRVPVFGPHIAGYARSPGCAEPREGADQKLMRS